MREKNSFYLSLTLLYGGHKRPRRALGILCVDQITLYNSINADQLYNIFGPHHSKEPTLKWYLYIIKGPGLF